MTGKGCGERRGKKGSLGEEKGDGREMGGGGDFGDKVNVNDSPASHQPKRDHHSVPISVSIMLPTQDCNKATSVLTHMPVHTSYRDPFHTHQWITPTSGPHPPVDHTSLEAHGSTLVNCSMYKHSQPNCSDTDINIRTYVRIGACVRTVHKVHSSWYYSM